MKTTSTETFKQNATVKHEGFYTYDKAVWVSNKTKLLFTYPVDKGYKAYFVEQQLLKQHADKKCGSKLLQSGNTELFNQDCISLLEIEEIMNGFKATSSSH